jgi:ribosomal protein L11 methyltransferase
VVVPAAALEEARARMLELFPEGFEEAEAPGGLELAVYTAASGEQRLRRAFDGIASTPVPGDWADRWRQFHTGVRVGRFWIGPPWEQPPAGLLAVVIDPGRAFGTGTHATTRLCLELLGSCEPASLLDAGCGSGVLAIAAARLRFGPIVALDSDPAAVDAARANAARNGVALDVRKADALVDPLPVVDVAVANLTLRAIQSLAPRLSARLLIASGYLENEALQLARFERRERRTAEGWAADVFERAE